MWSHVFWTKCVSISGLLVLLEFDAPLKQPDTLMVRFAWTQPQESNLSNDV